MRHTRAFAVAALLAVSSVAFAEGEETAPATPPPATEVKQPLTDVGSGGLVPAFHAGAISLEGSLGGSNPNAYASPILPAATFGFPVEAAILYFLSTRGALRLGAALDLGLIGGFQLSLALSLGYRLYMAAIQKMVMYMEPYGALGFFAVGTAAAQVGLVAGARFGLEYFIFEQFSLAAFIGGFFFVTGLGGAAPFGGIHSDGMGVAARLYF